MGSVVRDSVQSVCIPPCHPLSWLHPFDTDIINRPQARFAGTVRVGDRVFSVPETRGLISHYWGRRLMDRWWWISANRFDQPGIALEVSVARSRLWGMPAPAVNIGYLWLQTPTSSHMVKSPVNGIISVTGASRRFTVTQGRSPGRTIRLSCGAPLETYNDLGEGIRQTLLARAPSKGSRPPSGTAGLERRQRFAIRPEREADDGGRTPLDRFAEGPEAAPSPSWVSSPGTTGLRCSIGSPRARCGRPDPSRACRIARLR